MRHPTLLPALAAALLLAACTAAPAPRPGNVVIADSVRIVDLTHAFDEDTVYWPTDTEGFVLEEVFVGEAEGGYHYEAHRFRAAEHGGTHLDAPVHFAAGAWTADEIPLERLVGPGLVVDVRESVAADRDHLVGVEDLRRWEAVHGRIPAGAVVLLHTGTGAAWPDRAAVLGTDRTGPDAVPHLHFPGLDPAAARWLVEERSVDAVGIDTPSIDRGQSQLFESHRVLFAANVPAFENVAHLDRLPATGFTVVALPMKIRGGSGGPLRIVALLPGE